MTSRERVLTTIAHKEPDRVPIDLGATPSSGISAQAYARLQQHLGYNEPTQIYDVVQQLAQPSDRIVEEFGVDVLDIGRVFNEKDSHWYPVDIGEGLTGMYPTWFRPERLDSGAWIAKDDGKVLATMPEGSTFFDQTYFPWVDGYPDSRSGIEEQLDAAMDTVLWQRYVHSPWDHASEPDFWEQLRSRTLRLRESTDKALMMVCGCNLYEWGTFLRRMDNFLMDLYVDQDHVAMVMESLMTRHMATLEKVCESVGDIVDIIRFGDDLGMDSGPFMGLDVYRSLFHDHRTQLCDYVHKHSSMHTFLHSCGSIEQYLPSLIESGIEIINPVQTNCRDMDAASIKKEYGKDIVFWGGGVDPREILNRGTPEQVREDVLKRLEIFAPDGGYVFNVIHNILPDVPSENVVALFDAVHEFSKK